MPGPTPTLSELVQRKGDFATLTDALDYAAGGTTGLNFYSVNGTLTEALTYCDLRADALRLARRLIGLGLQRHDRLAIVADTTPDFVRLFFASQYAGLIPVPLPLPFAFGGRDIYLAHIRRLVEASRASALFAPPALAAWVAPMGSELGLQVCGVASDLEAAPVSDMALPTIAPDDTAYLQFSSGSTRFPMGVVVRHEALMANAAATLTYGLQIRPDDRAVSWLPLYHDMGLVGFLLTPLAGQATVDLLATRDFARRPHIWLSLIASGRGTISFSPSFGYDLCARRQRAGDVGGLDLSSWRIAGVGGDMIRASILDDFAEKFAGNGFSPTAFLPSYGMAEATLAISFAPTGRGIETDLIDLDALDQRRTAEAPRSAAARKRSLVLCGKVLPGHAMQIRAAGAVVLQERLEGRIFVRGPSLMQGYDGRPGETEQTLSDDGWLDTGDLGYWLRGSLVVTGRAKDLIIINGRNIWPQDLEWTVEHAVPGVRTGNVAAFSVEESGREILIVAVDPKGVGAPAVGQLATDIGEAVRAQHGLEGRVILVPPSSLPYTSSGKLSRVGARQRYLAGQLFLAAAPA